MCDLIIIGSGPAGLSSALYVLRAGFTVKIIAKDGGSLQKAEKIENYLGFETPVTGSDLLKMGKNQVKRLGANIINDEVTGISWNGGFIVSTPSVKEKAKAVIIATGAVRKAVSVPNLSEFEGAGVSYCAVCDAFFYRGKNVAVLGSGEFALNEVKELLGIANSVSLLTNGTEINADFPESVKIYPQPIKEIIGDTTLQGVRFNDETVLPLDGLFVAFGTADASALAKELGLALKNGKIAVDENMRTSLKGAFAAGDCVGGVLQISVAVGEGATAGLSAVQFLRELR